MKSFSELLPGDVVNHYLYGDYTFFAKCKNRYLFTGGLITDDRMADRFVNTGKKAENIFLANNTALFLDDAKVTRRNIENLKLGNTVLVEIGKLGRYFFMTVSALDFDAGAIQTFGQIIDVEKVLVYNSGF